MLKTYVVVAVLAVFSTAYGMEKEQTKPEYIEDARHLKQEKGLYFSILPKDVLGIVQHYRLNEELDKALSDKTYSETLTGIEKLAQLNEYGQLFSNPLFIDGIINRLSNTFGKNPEEVARDINRSGASSWLMRIRPDQLKLLQATAFKDLGKVQQLIALGVNVDARSSSGNSALMWAALNGDVEAVRILIAAKANVNAQDKHGWTALIHAAIYERTEVIKELIGAGADFNAQDVEGWTALMRAAMEGHTEVIKALIVAEADVTAQNKFGKTALEYAQSRGYKEIIKLLETFKNT